MEIFLFKDFFVRIKKYLILQNIRDLLIKNYFTLKPNIKSSTFAINQLIKYCKKYKCRPYVGYIPNSKKWSNVDLSSLKKELFKNFENKISMIDFSYKITKDSENTYAKKGPHLSPIGYKLIYLEIEKILHEK